MATDRGMRVRVVSIVILILIWIVVPLRLYCRRFIVRSLGVDDYLMAVLLVVFSTYLLNLQAGVDFGMGVPRDELTEPRRHSALKSYYVGEVLYLVCTCLMKISVGFFLLRVTIDAKLVMATRLLMAATVLFGTVYFFMAVFQCVPVNSWWDDNPRSEGHCWPDNIVLGMTFWASSINCFADFSFASLPVLIVWPLSMPVARKLLVVAILGLATVGSAATIVRATLVPGLLDGENFLYTNADFALWSTVEVGIGMLAASFACLRPLTQLIQYVFGRRNHGPNNQRWQRWEARRRQRTRGSRRGAAVLDDDDVSVDILADDQEEHTARTRGHIEQRVDVRDGGGTQGWMWLSKLSSTTDTTMASSISRCKSGMLRSNIGGNVAGNAVVEDVEAGPEASTSEQLPQAPPKAHLDAGIRLVNLTDSDSSPATSSRPLPEPMANSSVPRLALILPELELLDVGKLLDGMSEREKTEKTSHL